MVLKRMQMKIVPFLLLILFVTNVLSAKQHKHNHQNTPKDGVVKITMRRTPCHGSCPSYEIGLNRSGMVTYTGYRFVKDTGSFRNDIGAKRAVAILNYFNEFRLDTCQVRNKMRAQDLPGIVFKIQYQDSIKTINHAEDGPNWLRQLADTVDKYCLKTGDKGWKKSTQK